MNTDQALACIDGDTFDCFLFDYRLGREDGLALLAAIREQGVETPVIILTGQGDEEIAVSAMKLGAADYIPKRRLTAELLLHAVRYSIELHRSGLLRQQAEEALRESEERYRELVTTIPSAVCELAADGSVLFANPATCAITGYAPEELAGADWWKLLRVAPADRAMSHTGEDTAGTRLVRMELAIRAKDGSQKVLNWSVSRRPEKNSGDGHLVCVGVDITELVRLKEELKEMAVTDELTGILNRRGFWSLAGHQLKAAQRDGKDLFLLYADLDNMKTINDTLGHEAGDQALRDTATLLHETFRESDVIGRMGGDEFAVLVASPPGRESRYFIDRLEKNLTGGNKGAAAPIALSCGVACRRPGDSITLEELISLADSRMYENKKQRKAARQEGL